MNVPLTPGQRDRLKQGMSDVASLLITVNARMGEASDAGHRLTEAVVLLAVAVNEATEEETT